MEHLPGLILGFTALAIFVAVAWYIVCKIRSAGASTSTPSAQEMLLRFTKMYDDGELSKEEFRAIRTLFAASLKAQPTSSASSSDQRSDEEKARESRLEELLRSERR